MNAKDLSYGKTEQKSLQQTAAMSKKGVRNLYQESNIFAIGILGRGFVIGH